MKGIGEALKTVAETGASVKITHEDPKEITKACRQIGNQIEFKKEYWDLEFVREGNTITISKRK